MFSLATLATVAIALASPFFMNATAAVYDTLFEAQYAAMAIVAFYSQNTRRDKAVITVLLIWAVWVLATDWTSFDFSPVYINFEAAAFSALTLWALVRPYEYTSDKLNQNDIFIGFYQGRNKHILSVLASLVGLPFSSIALIAGDYTIRAGGGVLKEVPTSSLMEEHYVFVNTTLKVTKQALQMLRAMVGVNTMRYGFRIGCIAAMKTGLSDLGYQLSWYDYVPSFFYRTVLRKAK